MTINQEHNDNTRSFVPISNGTMIAHYRIVEKIGAGGMGEVYLAEDTELNRKVALKFLPLYLCPDEDCRARFKREARAAARLNHPNIVTIYEVSDYQGRPFFAMELVEGQSLRDLAKGEELRIDIIIELAIQICDGLSAAHDKKVIHRDIKPSNIVIDAYGRPKILDFGLAAIQGSEHLTKTGSTMGTVQYMSPEQVGGKDVDFRSDLFSLGVVLYELISGRTPFEKDNEAATLKAITQDNPEPLARFKADIPDELQRTVSKLLEKDPSLRYQSAIGVKSDFNTMARDQQSTDKREVSRPSIAVLPFTNLSADPEQEYFCDGMAEEIINALTSIENFRVIARTSAFAFKGKHGDIREIGRKLGVGTLLEGSVRKADNRLRITAQLVKVADGSHLWSERFDRELEDVFAIQDEISLVIANKLKLKLLDREKAAILKRSTENLEAFNFYLMGRFFSEKKTESGLRKSIECFHNAIELDPEFSLAFSGLGYSYLRLAIGNLVPKADTFKVARTKAIKAIALDDHSSLAHTLLAETLMWGDYDWPGAEREFVRALTLNPSEAAVHHGYAHLMEILGRSEKSIMHMKRAQQLEPLSIEYNTCLGQVLYHGRRYQEAINQLQKVIEMDPDYTEAYDFLARAYIQQEKYAEAMAILEPLEPLDQHPRLLELIGYIHAVSSKKNEAISILQRLERISQVGQTRNYSQVIINMALGEKDRAMDALENQVNFGGAFSAMLKVDPFLDGLRKTELFKNLLKNRNLE